MSIRFFLSVLLKIYMCVMYCKLQSVSRVSIFPGKRYLFLSTIFYYRYTLMLFMSIALRYFEFQACSLDRIFSFSFLFFWIIIDIWRYTESSLRRKMCLKLLLFVYLIFSIVLKVCTNFNSQHKRLLLRGHCLIYQFSVPRDVA